MVEDGRRAWSSGKVIIARTQVNHWWNMPRYYLHDQNGELLRDEVGQELGFDEHAKIAARAAAGELIAEQVSKGEKIDLFNRILVERDGKLVFVLEFRSLFKNLASNPWMRDGAHPISHK